MTQRVKCPGEGKETFLCHHARTSMRSRSMVGAMPCARPVTGPIQLALSFANRVLDGWQEFLLYGNCGTVRQSGTYTRVM